MKALTVCQPYAELIVRGEKRVENRAWPTRYTGPLLIHAGKSRDWLDLSEDGLREECYEIPLAAMDFGAIVGICDLIACLPVQAIRRRRLHASLAWLYDHAHVEGPWCWILAGVQRLERPVPYRGNPGLFEVDYDLLACEHDLIWLAPGLPAARCRECGCTEHTPCEDPDTAACYWIEPDLCSACAKRTTEHTEDTETRR